MSINTNPVPLGSVTFAKMADLAANSFVGNNTGSAATPIALTVSQARAALGLATTDLLTFAGISFGSTTVAGLRLNNLTTVQRDASGPAAGAYIFNTTTNRSNLFDGTNWTPGFARIDGDTFTGAINSSFSAPLSTSVVRLNGDLLTGALQNTVFPQYLSQPASLGPANWVIGGTYFGLNAATGFTGRFIDCRVNGVNTTFGVSATGQVVVVDTGSISIGTSRILGTPGFSEFRNISTTASVTYYGNSSTTNTSQVFIQQLGDNRLALGSNGRIAVGPGNQNPSRTFTAHVNGSTSGNGGLLVTLGSASPGNALLCESNAGVSLFSVGSVGESTFSGIASFDKTRTSATSFETLTLDSIADASNYRIGSRIGSAGGSTRGLDIGRYDAAAAWQSWLSFTTSGAATFSGDIQRTNAGAFNLRSIGGFAFFPGGNAGTSALLIGGNNNQPILSIGGYFRIVNVGSTIIGSTTTQNLRIQSNSIDAIVIDQLQNVTFSGALQLGNAAAAATPTATHTVTIRDSTGTTYRLLAVI